VGYSNTASGYQALYGNTSGTGNIGIGYQAGYNLTSGNYNIDIANNGVAGESNTIRIGAPGLQDRTFIAGIAGVTTGGGAVQVLVDPNGQLGIISSSRRYKFDIGDMNSTTDNLMRLRPVTFRYRAHGDNAPLQYGLIAEEVAEVYPELVTRNKDGEVEAVMYQFLAPMLLNEVQKQRRQIEQHEQRIGAQQKSIDELRSTLDTLRQELRAMKREPAESK
jgi:polyhydroxyalkanoate synthesis regulator phasin